tara:strand:- start:285 stop:1496 length:1212 start_codon:yes stop_codon:yes gene_type:complete
MAYIGRQQDGFGVRSRFIYTATGGQTTFNTDDSGNALSYADGAYVDVYLNGVLLDPADYTDTSLTSIVLDSGATASDILEVIVYDVFSVFSGTFTNGITANTATVTGDLTISDKIVHSDDTNTNIRFPAVDTVAIETAGSERMRVASDGTVMIAQTSDNSGVAGHIFTPEGAGFHIRDGGLPFVINRLTDDGAVAEFRQDGNTDGQINTKSGDIAIGTGDTGVRFNDNLNAIQPFNVSTNAAINDTIDLGSSGAKFNEAYINGGVYIGGTSSDNLLDDYEEGTWTPTFEAGSATVANALYIRIGRFVQVAAVISSFTDRTSTSNLDISGLPFASATSNKTSQSIMCRFINAGGDSVAAYIAASVSKISFYGISQGAGYARVNHNELNSSSANLFITCTYRCAA